MHFYDPTSKAGHALNPELGAVLRRRPRTWTRSRPITRRSSTVVPRRQLGNDGSPMRRMAVGRASRRHANVSVGSKCEILATSRYFLLMARDQTLAVRRTPCAGNGRRATLQAVDLYGLCRKRPQRGGLYSASAALCASQKRTRHFAAGPSLGRNRQRGRLAHALYAATHTGGIRANTGFALRPQCR